MNFTDSQYRQIVKLTLATGVLASIIYPILITYHARDFWSLLLEVLFGPLYIACFFGLFLFLGRHGDSIFNWLAVIFHTLSGFCITLMFNVQKSVFSIGPEYRTLETEWSREIFERSFRVGNLTQLGMDFCFDIFVSFGAVCFGLALLHQRALWRPLGYGGIVVGIGGLLLNMLVFPTPPADLHYPDPGPWFSIFFGCVLLNLAYFVIRETRSGRTWV